MVTEYQIQDLTRDATLLAQTLEEVKNNFLNWIKNAQVKGIVLGFDGYIDELVSVVRLRSTLTQFEPMHSMKEWAERINKAAGSSAGLEVVPKVRRTGGFTPNTGQALASILYPVHELTMIGNFGTPQIQPLFADIFGKKLKCRLISIGNPGTTAGYEFDDGKIMMTNFTPIHNNTPEEIQNFISTHDLESLLSTSALFGIGYFSTSPTVVKIYKYLSEIVFPKLVRSNTLDVFLDLADIRKKTDADLKEVKAIFNNFPKTVETSLSLNDSEAIRLGVGLSSSETQLNAFKQTSTVEQFVDLLKFLKSELKMVRIVIHTPQFALGVKENRIVIVPNTFTAQPKTLVAAGDTFNAGLCFSILAKIDLAPSLLIANALTSYFIRTAERGNAQNILRFIDHYLEYLKTSDGIIL